MKSIIAFTSRRGREGQLSVTDIPPSGWRGKKDWCKEEIGEPGSAGR